MTDPRKEPPKPHPDEFDVQHRDGGRVLNYHWTGYRMVVTVAPKKDRGE